MAGHVYATTDTAGLDNGALGTDRECSGAAWAGISVPASDRCEAGVVCCSVCGCLLCSFLHVCHVLLARVSTVLTYWAIRAVEMARSERLEVTECDIS